MELINRLRTILLALVLVPLLAAATAPGAASAQSTTAHYVKLVSLDCIETEDTTGADELYLKIRGKTVWSGNLNNGGDVDLATVPSKEFYGQTNIDLYDDDWPDADDWLGSNAVYATEAGQGDHTVSFKEDGAHYVLTYRVQTQP